MPARRQRGPAYPRSQTAAQEVFLCYGAIQTYLDELDTAAQHRKICTIIGVGGAGKSALTRYWHDQGSRYFRPHDILIVPLVPATEAYKSTTHMLYARLRDELQKHSPPPYVPRGLLRRYEADYFGKKNIERLRKDIVSQLAKSPIVALVFDGTEHLDKPALFAALGFLRRYALIFSGQQRSAPEDKQLNVWLTSITEAREAWTHAIEIQRPTWQELRGSKEQRGLIRELLDDHVRAIVPPNEHRTFVNDQLGKLVNATHRDWGSIARLMVLIDAHAESQAASEVRHITHRTIDRIIEKLRLIDPTAVQTVVQKDSKKAAPQDKQLEQGKHRSGMLSLDEEQRVALEQIRDTHTKPVVRERAAAILLFAEGKSLADIAGSYPKPINHETIRRWLRRYRSEGIAGLETKPGQGRQPRNTAESSAAEIPQ